MKREGKNTPLIMTMPHEIQPPKTIQKGGYRLIEWDID